MSENCSSPNDQYDDYKQSFDDNDGDGSSPVRPSFGGDTNDNTFYNKQSSQNKGDTFVSLFEDNDIGTIQPTSIFQLLLSLFFDIFLYI